MEVVIKPWHGIPRENIKWHPTVDESKCIGCGKKVYGFDYEKKIAAEIVRGQDPL